ncbi:MAG: LD-carboxypeptidase [Okeania sp. SIO3B5]|uniref:S66 peptidase family protein n=1 Tax=Okeania sp. SIO3B5 TaxID=2607811 RepID=UPI0014012118|nr:LD-carboxypeptidase [Okeania sp. SIO3B5]NEO57997.1 LD-carboxypeptidase [Okeania sp. SIO3B5]
MLNQNWLKPGDLLQVISPSGCLRELDAFEKGVEIWRSRNYKVELTPGYDEKWGYLAGTDESRLTQLAAAISNENYPGLLCSRGGYGTTRLLENWQNLNDFSLPTPKWLIGFSDITALLWTFYKISNFSCVHGPLLTTLAAEPEWSIQRLFDLVEGRSLEPLKGNGWGGGQAKGYLMPANLTVAGHLLGTKYQPDLSGTILALEDTNEAPYRIDRMLTHWRMAGVLQQVNGIALGRFSQSSGGRMDNTEFTVEDVLRDRLSDLNIPIVSELPFGHDGPNAALPVGVEANIDGDKGILEVIRK